MRQVIIFKVCLVDKRKKNDENKKNRSCQPFSQILKNYYHFKVDKDGLVKMASMLHDPFMFVSGFLRFFFQKKKKHTKMAFVFSFQMLAWLVQEASFFLLFNVLTIAVIYLQYKSLSLFCWKATVDFEKKKNKFKFFTLKQVKPNCACSSPSNCIRGFRFEWTRLSATMRQRYANRLVTIHVYAVPAAGNPSLHMGFREITFPPYTTVIHNYWLN